MQLPDILYVVPSLFEPVQTGIYVILYNFILKCNTNIKEKKNVGTGTSFIRKNQGCRFILLLPNSTHMLQPLDVAVFWPMKRRWKEVLSEWKQQMTREGKTFVSIPKQVIKIKGKKFSSKLNYKNVNNGTVPYYHTTKFFQFSSFLVS